MSARRSSPLAVRTSVTGERDEEGRRTAQRSLVFGHSPRRLLDQRRLARPARARDKHARDRSGARPARAERARRERVHDVRAECAQGLVDAGELRRRGADGGRGGSIRGWGGGGIELLVQRAAGAVGRHRVGQSELTEEAGWRATHDGVGEPGALLCACSLSFSRSLAAARAFLACDVSGAPSLCIGNGVCRGERSPPCGRAGRSRGHT